MKKLFTSILAVLLCITAAIAQNDNYVQEMTSAIAAMNGLDRTRPDVNALKTVAGSFERIATAQPKEWLPRYYAAFSYIQLGFAGNSVDEKDQYFNKAQALLKEAEILAGKPSDEIMIMKAFEAQIRLAADAMNRWEEQGQKFNDFLIQAKSLNPENPRIYYLEGSRLFFTPEEYGGGKKAAKPVLEKAAEKFSVFKPESAIYPDWGKTEAEWMLSQCN